MPAPTGVAAYDAALLVGAGVLLAWACWSAPRWMWFWLAGVTAAFVEREWLAIPAAMAALALVGMLVDRLRLPVAVLLAGAAVVALSNLREVGFLGLPTLIAMGAALPLVTVAVILATWRTQVILRVAASALMLVSLAGLGSAIAVAVLAEDDARRAIDTSRAAVDAARDGDTEAAEALFASARDDFAAISARTGAWWAKPARLVPVVAQHMRMLHTMAADGVDLAGTAADAIGEADVDKLQPRNGAIDLSAVRTMAEPLSAMEAALVRTAADVDEVRSPWLVAPVVERLDELEAEITDVLPDVEVAADAVEVLPGLLGGDGVRRYLVLFGQLAELRDGGGVIAAWSELVAVDGRLVLARNGSNDQLNDELRKRAVQITDPGSYPERYLDYQLLEFSQNWLATPDFPTAARLAADLYQQATNRTVNGVVYMDGAGLAALLALTGPVQIAGLDDALSSDSVQDFLAVDQYLQFPDRAERKDFLSEIGAAAFEQLLVADLPEPQDLIDPFRDAIGENHLNLWTFAETEQAVLRRADLDGALPVPGAATVLGVRAANNGADKLDAHINRTGDYRIRVDPATGEVTADVRVTFTNNVPARMPFPVVEFPPPGQPIGTAALIVSLYANGTITSAEVEGVAAPTVRGTDFGYQRTSVFFDLPPGESRTVAYAVTTTTADPAGFVLDLLAQPAIEAEKYTATITVGGTETTFGGILDEDQALTPGAAAEDL
jgi:hypothetical protein